MDFFSWKESFNTRVGTMDDQHRKFVSLLNELHDAVEKKWDRVVLESLLDDFARYAQVHFTEEEKLLESIGFTDLMQHRKEHEYFISQVKILQSRHERGDALIGNSALQFARDWLIDHILTEDRKYGEFLFANPI